MLIGVPVAATPGFLPHVEVLVELVLAVVALALELVALDPPLAAALEVLLLLLLPQPATANAPMSPASAKLVRRRSAW
jgi:hypothetical protein